MYLKCKAVAIFAPLGPNKVQQKNTYCTIFEVVSNQENENVEQ